MLSNLRTTKFSLLALQLVVSTVVGQQPTPWPLGCPAPHTIVNNSSGPMFLSVCTPTVTNAAGQVVSQGGCAPFPAMISTGGRLTIWWNQQSGGQQVPPGVYFVNSTPYDIGNFNIGITMLGAPHPGTNTRNVHICAPSQANAPFLCAAAFSSNVGIPLGCGRTFPLDPDALFAASLGNSTVFPSFVGTLDPAGKTDVPAIALPPLNALLGIAFEIAAVTVETAAPCGIGAISAAVPVVVQ